MHNLFKQFPRDDNNFLDSYLSWEQKALNNSEPGNKCRELIASFKSGKKMPELNVIHGIPYIITEPNIWRRSLQSYSLLGQAESTGERPHI